MGRLIAQVRCLDPALSQDSVAATRASEANPKPLNPEALKLPMALYNKEYTLKS